MTEVLRPYQAEVIAEFWRAVEAGQRRILLVAPTAAGKTVIAAPSSNRRAAKTVARCFSPTAAKSSPRPATSCAASRTESSGPATDRDRWSRCRLQHADAAPPRHQGRHDGIARGRLVIVDEAHHCPARTYREIIDAYPNAVLLGLTATPCRGDGRGLGSIFQTMIQCPQVGELVEQGYPGADPRLCGGRS